VFKRYIGIQELSEYLSIPKGTIYVWVCHRRIPYAKVGKLLRFDLQEIENWLKIRKVEMID
jgi:excisionase family DNA binding protein